MRPGKEMDTRIAREVFGNEVWATNRTVHERAGTVKRLLRPYSKEMESAWEVAAKMRITVVPVRSGEWFAFSAPGEGWESPQAFAEFLNAGNFQGCGAALSDSAPIAICEAALRAVEKRRNEAAIPEGAESSLQ